MFTQQLRYQFLVDFIRQPTINHTLTHSDNYSMSFLRITLECTRCQEKFTQTKPPMNLGCKSQHTLCQQCWKDTLQGATSGSTFECGQCFELLNMDDVRIDQNKLDIINLLKSREQTIASKFASQIESLKGIIRQYRENVKTAENRTETAKNAAKQMEMEAKALRVQIQSLKSREIQKIQQYKRLQQIEVRFSEEVRIHSILKANFDDLQHQIFKLLKKGEEMKQQLEQKVALKVQLKKIRSLCDDLEQKYAKETIINRSLLRQLEQQRQLVNRYKSIYNQAEVKESFESYWKLCLSFMHQKLNKTNYVESEDVCQKSESERTDINGEQTAVPQSKGGACDKMDAVLQESLEADTSAIGLQSKVGMDNREKIVEVYRTNQQEVMLENAKQHQCDENQANQYYQQAVSLIESEAGSNFNIFHKVTQPILQATIQPALTVQNSQIEVKTEMKSQEAAASPPIITPNPNSVNNSKQTLNKLKQKSNTNSKQHSKENSKQNSDHSFKHSQRGNDSQPNKSMHNSMRASTVSNNYSQVLNREEIHGDDYEQQDIYENYAFGENQGYNKQQDYPYDQQRYQNQQYNQNYQQYPNQSKSQNSKPQQQHKNHQYSQNEIQQRQKWQQMQMQAYAGQYGQQYGEYKQTQSYPQQQNYNPQQPYAPQPQCPPQKPTNQKSYNIPQHQNQVYYDYRGLQYGEEGFWQKVQQEQEEYINFPARTLSDFKNIKNFRDDVMKDTIVQTLKQIDKSRRFTDEELFMIGNLEKKKTHAISKFEIINKIKKTGDRRYTPLFKQLIQMTLSTIKEIKLSNLEIEKIIDLKEIATLQKLDLSFNKIRRIEGFDNNIHLRIVLLNDNLIERIENMAKLREIHYIALHKNNIRKEFAEVIKKSSYDKLQELSIQFVCSTPNENLYCLSTILSKHWANLRTIYYSTVAGETPQPYLQVINHYNRQNMKPQDKLLSLVL